MAALIIYEMLLLKLNINLLKSLTKSKVYKLFINRTQHWTDGMNAFAKLKLFLVKKLGQIKAQTERNWTETKLKA